MDRSYLSADSSWNSNVFSSETTAKGTGLGAIAGNEDPVELKASVAGDPL
jgi:hypothetical protein